MKIQAFLLGALLGLATGGAVADEPTVAAAPPQAGRTETAEAKPADTAAPRAAPRKAANGLDGRVQLLAKELDLDEHQQAEVRKILLQQREEVKQAWSNAAVPSEVRIATMRAAGDRTAARIRAILNDTQREKYIKERPARPERPQSDADLHRWIGAVGKP